MDNEYYIRSPLHLSFSDPQAALHFTERLCKITQIDTYESRINNVRMESDGRLHLDLCRMVIPSPTAFLVEIWSYRNHIIFEEYVGQLEPYRSDGPTIYFQIVNEKLKIGTQLGRLEPTMYHTLQNAFVRRFDFLDYPRGGED